MEATIQYLDSAGLNTLIEALAAKFNSKVDNSTLTSYPTQEEVTKQITDAVTGGKVDLTGYATEEWVGENYQPVGDYATNTQVDNKIATALSAIDTAVFIVTNILPSTPSEGNENKIHVVPVNDPSTDATNDKNTYVEWLWIESEKRWEKLGEFKADISLEGYATESWVNSQISGVTSQAEEWIEENFQPKGDYATKEYVDNKFLSDEVNGYEYVDMGEAGVWAKYPIGVTEWTSDWYLQMKYFAWGDAEGYIAEEITSLHKFNWNDYKYCDGAINRLTKYCNNSSKGLNGFTDELTILEPEDDAAHVNMAGAWRMPTADEFQKLKDLCDSEFVLDYSGVPSLNGWVFTSKTDETRQVFIPCAGNNYNGAMNEDMGDVGYFWTSPLHTSDALQGKCVYLSAGGFNAQSNTYRMYGCPVIGFMPSLPEKYLTKKEAKETYQPKGDYITKEELDDILFEQEELMEDEINNCFLYTTESGEEVTVYDFGLPSGKLWYFGAYGGQFSWGGKEPDVQAFIDEGATYEDPKFTKYCNDPKYGTVDNLLTLQPEDDYLTNSFGSNFRVASIEEAQELADNVKANAEGVFANMFTMYSISSKNSKYTNKFGYAVDGSPNENCFWLNILDSSDCRNAYYLNLTDQGATIKTHKRSNFELPGNFWENSMIGYCGIFTPKSEKYLSKKEAQEKYVLKSSVSTISDEEINSLLTTAGII